MKKVTGIGGIFFKSQDPAQARAWYNKHLGLNTNDYGCTFEWSETDHPKQKGQTQWTPFSETSDYFQPSEKPFMVNFRVENLRELLATLKEEGVTIVGEMQEYEYGKFGWIMDPEGNKIELWEPVAE